MNCQNCNSTSQLTIAGKDFCANCGTAKFESTVNNTQTSSTNNTEKVAKRIITSPSSAATVTNSTNSNSNSNNSDSDNTTKDSVKDPNNLASINLATNYQPSPASPPTPSQTTTTQPINGNDSISNNQNSNPNNSSAVQRQAPVTTEQIQTQTPNINNQPVVKSESKQSVSTKNTNPTVNNVAPIQEVNELKNKKEDVFSDEQLDQLSNQAIKADNTISNPFATIQNNSQSPTVADIRPVSNTMNSAILSSKNAPQPVSNDQVVLKADTPATQSLSNAISDIPAPVSLPSQTQSPANNSGSSSGVSPTTQKTKQKFMSGKVASVGLSVVGVVLLGIYVWQINYPNLALKVASSKAGISASIPTNLPNGWKISGDIQTSPGSIGYKLSSSDGKKYVAVNQMKTDWDSQAMAENYLNSKTDSYTALQTHGLTIYLYKNNQASWVNHGTWYRIEGSNHGLNQDQIIKMATSL